jgi:hypothetical protein
VQNSFEFYRVSFELEILKIIIKLFKSPLASWAHSHARPSQPALCAAYSGPPDASVFLTMLIHSPSLRRRLEGNPSTPPRSSTESAPNQNGNRVGLESASITSCWNKPPYIRSCPERFSPSQPISNPSRHLSHRHAATCSPEPNQPP